ncbi:MAG: CBS domain-containing protein [Anaerolineae bacterium]|nr:CBS domain-containing protein [Anaerolineae bacterium]
MLVKDRMTANPVTITPETSLKDALALIRSQPFRHLPVVDEDNRPVGIVTEKSLVYASPSPDLSLSVFEIDYLLSRTMVSQIMQQETVVVSPEVPIEEAARIMVDHRIGCLPVVQDNRLVGIISDTDIFRVFVEGLGGGHPSLRVTVTIPERVGSLAQLANCIAQVGGNIHSLGTFWGEGPQDRILAFRVEGVDREELVASLESNDIQIRHIWEPESSS